MKVLLVIALYLAVLGVILMVGVKPTIQILKQMLNRLWNGPAQKRPSFAPQRGCKVLHDIASAEVEVYGKIVSDSVKDHINTCTKYYKPGLRTMRPFPTPRLPDPGRVERR